jgi:hypothetical protein
MESVARLVLSCVLMVVVGSPTLRARGQTPNPVFAAMANEKLAARDVQHLRGVAELAFIEALLASERREVALLLLDDEDLRDCLVERAEAVAADRDLAATYLDQHPLRMGSMARVSASEQAVEHLVASAVRGRQAMVEVLDAERGALRGAIEAQGGAPDPEVRRGALLRLDAELEVEHIGQRAATNHYRVMLEQSDVPGLLGALPERVRFLAQRTSRLLNNPRAASLVYGENHPSRIQQKEAAEQLQVALDEQLTTAIAAEEARIELGEAVQAAVTEVLQSP